MTRFALRSRDVDGRETIKAVGMELYAEAEDKQITLAELINAKFPTDDSEKYGTPFEQMQMNSGLVFRKDRKLGLKPPTLSELNGGMANVNMAGIVAPDGADALTVGGRFLFPATILEMVSSALMIDNSDYSAAFDSMVGQRVSVNSPRYDTPVIDLSAPRNSASNMIAQGEEPDVMATISMSSVSQRIETRSIGLKITDEAVALATIDLVGIVLREQAIGENIRRLDEDLLTMVNGSTASGTSALSSETATSYDSSISNAAGVLTQKAWLKWLRKDWKKMKLSHILCDMDVYLAVEARTNRPIFTNNPGTPGARADSSLDPVIMGLPPTLQLLPLDDAFLGANTLIGLDSSKAIRQITYAGGSYSAVEQFVLRRLSVFRFDVARRYERVFQDGRGWKKLTLT